jgi:hypothetical protein
MPLITAMGIAMMAIPSVATAQSCATTPARNADYWQNVSEMATNMGRARDDIRCNGKDDQF